MKVLAPEMRLGQVVGRMEYRERGERDVPTWIVDHPVEIRYMPNVTLNGKMGVEIVWAAGRTATYGPEDHFHDNNQPVEALERLVKLLDAHNVFQTTVGVFHRPDAQQAVAEAVMAAGWTDTSETLLEAQEALVQILRFVKDEVPTAQGTITELTRVIQNCEAATGRSIQPPKGVWGR